MTLCTVQIFALQLAFAGVLLASDDAHGQEDLANQHKSLKEITISIQEQDIALKKAFDLIHAETGLTFAYINSKIPMKKKVSIEATNAPLETILLSLSKDANLSFKRINNRIQVSKMQKEQEAIQEVINIQTKKVTGKITDDEGEGLPGVNVVLKGTAIGSITDLDGYYSIEYTDENSVLVISSVGFITREVAIDNRSVIDLMLDPDVTSLDEIVVTALGIEREERSLGYSVSEVEGEEIAQATTTNPITALQGKSPGVQINTTAGGTFGGARITLRGNATLGKNTQPIFVVDGIVMDNDISGNDGTDWGNQLKNLNADDFESISVLKGAAATALYGSRALHGVVMITTKSGSKRKGLGVSINQTSGFRKVYDAPAFQNEYGYGPTAGMFSNDVTNGRPDGDKHDTQQFAYYEMVNGQYIGSLQHNMSEENAASWGPKFDGQDYIDYDGSMTKWVAQPDNYKKMFETGAINNTNVAIDGGSEYNTFRISFSNFMDNGVEPFNDFSKNSISIKGTQDLVKDVITVGAGMQYTGSKMTNPPTGTLQSAWFHDGFPRSYDPDKWRDNYKAPDGGVPYPTNNGKYMYTKKSQRWFEIYDEDIERNESSLLANAYLDFKIAKGLSANIKGNINQFTYENETKKDATSLDRLSNASYSLSHGRRFQYSFGGSLTYEKELSNDLRFDILVGGETWNTDASSTGYSTRNGFKIRDWYNIKNSFDSPNISGGIGRRKTINSIYSYLNIDYKSTLYLSLTGRNDWSSALIYPDGSGNNSYFYPSASLSWVLNESISIPESIFAKLRVSYAFVGNDTDPYTLSSGFVSQTFNEEPTLGLYKFENTTAISPNIKPETKRSFETGFDVRFLNGRAGIDFAYYKDNTRDQIIPLSVPNESGITQQLINAGNLQNQGVELMIDGTPIQSGDFSWDIGLAISHNRDKIIDLYPGINEVILHGNPRDANAGTATYAYVGGEYGILSTYEGYKYYDGANTSNHDIPVLSQRNNWSVAYPNGRQNMDSLVRMGNMQPDWYGAINTTLHYKGFRLFALFDMSFGGDIYSSAYRYGLHQGVIEASLPNRDRENGGIVWTSEGMGNNYYGKEYEDGYIPEGVFPDGTVITFKDDNNQIIKQNDVGGMTYQEAYDQGLVEPTHWSGYIYRWTSASTGTPLMGIHESNWVVLRELTLGYDLPNALLGNSFINTASLSITGRDLGFLHNSMPDNINPVISNNQAGNALQMGFAPFVRSITMSLKFTF